MFRTRWFGIGFMMLNSIVIVVIYKSNMLDNKVYRIPYP